jgi:hypothetical protein
MSTHFMNPARGKHMSLGHEGNSAHGAGDVEDKSGQHKPPHIFIHSHSKGHTVHIHHADGGHEKHEHSHGDADGIAEHIHQHLGAAGGQPVASEGGPPPMEEEEFS